MEDLRSLYSALPQVMRSVAVPPADLDRGEKVLDGAIRRRELKNKLPPMYLRYGFLNAENQPPNADSKKQDLDRSPQVVGGGEDEDGYRVFEIRFSQDNCNYLFRLAFSPDSEKESDDDDENSHQEKGELGSDYFSDYGEEIDEDYEKEDDQETYEDEQSDDEEMTGDRTYFVRLVFKIEGERFLEKEDEFLFFGLQRVAGMSYKEAEEEKEEYEVSEISRKMKLMEVKIGEQPDDIRTKEDGEKRSRIIEYPAATAKGSKNGNLFRSVVWYFPRSSDDIITRKEPSVGSRIVRDHLQVHSCA